MKDIAVNELFPWISKTSETKVDGPSEYHLICDHCKVDRRIETNSNIVIGHLTRQFIEVHKEC